MGSPSPQYMLLVGNLKYESLNVYMNSLLQKSTGIIDSSVALLPSAPIALKLRTKSCFPKLFFYLLFTFRFPKTTLITAMLLHCLKCCKISFYTSGFPRKITSPHTWEVKLPSTSCSTHLFLITVKIPSIWLLLRFYIII